MGSLMHRVQIEGGISKDAYDPRGGEVGNLCYWLFSLAMIVLKLLAIPYGKYWLWTLCWF